MHLQTTLTTQPQITTYRFATASSDAELHDLKQAGLINRVLYRNRSSGETLTVAHLLDGNCNLTDDPEFVQTVRIALRDVVRDLREYRAMANCSRSIFAKRRG